MNVLVFCLPVVLLTPILLLMTWFASRSWIAVADNGTISFEFSDDPGDDVVIDFIAVRPTG